MFLGLPAAFASPTEPNPLAGTAGKGMQWGHKFGTIYLTLLWLWRDSLSQANLKKTHGWEWNPASAVSDLMLILV